MLIPVVAVSVTTDVKQWGAPTYKSEAESQERGSFTSLYSIYKVVAHSKRLRSERTLMF